jgi:hypothetical protein
VAKSGLAKAAEPTLPLLVAPAVLHACANTGVVVPSADIANPVAKTADNIIATIRLFLFIFSNFSLKII